MENTLIEEIQNFVLTKRLNILIGSGVSTPAIPLMGQLKIEDEEERNKKLEEKVARVSGYLLHEKEQSLEKEMIDKIELTLTGYRNFINTLRNILNKANSRQVPKNVNIFTTNYDLFIERAVDDTLKNLPFVFNDGASGYFNRFLSSANFNKTVAYKGIHDNYINEIPSITLIKPHGSINWERHHEEIMIKQSVVDKPVIVKPDGNEERETFLNNHFHEMLRVFQLELDKPQSILLTIGFSFQDQHIGKMIKRAIQNPELKIYMFGYEDGDRETYIKNLNLGEEIPNNLVIITPKDLPKSLTLTDMTSEGEKRTFNIYNFTELLNGDLERT